jgi:uncharacterized protein YcbX
MCSMDIRRLGSSPLKGGRHNEHGSVAYSPDGPEGDREFAVVDVAARRVLKTVENPALLSCEAHWRDGVLSIDVDGETHTARPRPVGPPVDLDYWGRAASVRIVDGPWAAPLSRLLGREVRVARAASPGALVYGDPVSIVTTGSLARLAEVSGGAVDERRFRANLVVDTGDAEAHAEDGWAGRELEAGTVRLRVADSIARCAVIDVDPRSATSGSRLLRSLADYRLRAGEIGFGVYATVLRPGVITRGDAVRVVPSDQRTTS